MTWRGLEAQFARGLRAVLRRLPLSGGQYRLVNNGPLRRLGAKAGIQHGTLRSGVSILCDLDDHDGRALWFSGTNDPKVALVVRKLVRVGDVVVDVGANHGEHSLSCARAVGPKGVVHAFEPNPRLADRIRRSAREFGLSNLFIHEVALSDVDGTRVLFIPSGWSGGGREILASGRPGEGRVEVVTHRGDTVLPSLGVQAVRLLKVDVEGHERAVLRGARTWLGAVRPETILLESNPSPTPFWQRGEIREVLYAGPYEFFEIPRCLGRLHLRHLRRGRAVRVTGRDVLAVREDHVDRVRRSLGENAWTQAPVARPAVSPPAPAAPPRIRLALRRPQELAPEVRVLGSRVHLMPKTQVLDRMETWIAAGPSVCRQIVVTGFHGLWEAACDPSLRRMFNEAALWIPDGIAPVWLARLHGHKRVDRLPGAELMTAYFDRANEKGYRSFFYGSDEKTVAVLKHEIQKRWPGHVWAGHICPPFRDCTPEEDAAYVRQINDARPDVVWVGLGLPKQERWIDAHLHRLDVPLAIGVGAAFSFLSGKVKRAPRWIGKAGFEWAYRLGKEPRQTWHRALVQGPQFVAAALMELMGVRHYDYSYLEPSLEELEAVEALRRRA